MKRCSILSLAILLVCMIFAPLSAAAERFSFMVTGDSRSSGRPSPVLDSIMHEAALLQPDFVVHTGDWMDAPDEAGWRNFLTVMKSGKVPYHLVIGNHETGKDWKDLYGRMIGKPLYYSFSHKGTLFIILCCYAGEKSSLIDSAQFQWLTEQLQRKGKTAGRIFVFAHEPLYPVGPHIGSSLDKYPGERDKLAGLFRRYGNKLIFFCSHEHLYSKKTVDGLTQIISAGAGAPLYASPEKGGFYHYLYVTVSGSICDIALIKPGSIFGDELLSDPAYQRRVSRERREAAWGVIPVAELPGPVRIDGDLSDWKGIVPLHLEKDDLSPEDLAADVYLSWDKDNFYFGVEVTDDAHVNGRKGADIWNGDCIQIAFDALGNAGKAGYDSDDREFGLALAAAGQVFYCWKGTSGPGAMTFPAAVIRKGNRTCYEAAMPLQEIFPVRPAAGLRFGLNLAVLDDDTGTCLEGRVELSGGIVGGKDPSLFRKFMFAESAK